jgi:hypothetical protein
MVCILRATDDVRGTTDHDMFLPAHSIRLYRGLTYESGHTGEAPLAGFAIRGRELVNAAGPRSFGARDQRLAVLA